MNNIELLLEFLSWLEDNYYESDGTYYNWESELSISRKELINKFLESIKKS